MLLPILPLLPLLRMPIKLQQPLHMHRHKRTVTGKIIINSITRWLQQQLHFQDGLDNVIHHQLGVSLTVQKLIKSTVEYFLAQSKKGRQTYQRYQTSVLESKFQQSSYVSKKQREELRLQTNLTDRQIKIWFQNRRMKAKKEKNRCDEQTEHQTLIPANPPKNLMPGSNGSMHPHQQNHLLMDDPLGIGLDQDKLKSNSQANSMLNNPQHQMWCSSVNMNGNGAAGMHGMVSSMADTMASWSMLPPTATQLHSQGANVTSATSHPHYAMGYPICPPNI